MTVVDAYLGLGSRYSYLASTQLDVITIETGATFNWIPISSPDLFPPNRNPFEGEPISGQYEWFYRRQDAETWADYYRVPYREPMGRLKFDPRLLTRAALAAGELKKRAAMMRRLFAAVFVDDRSDIDATTCVNCAVDIGLDRKAFRSAFDDPSIEAERLTIGERASARGVFGVPYFIVGTRGYFGNDRLVLLTHHLKKAASAGQRPPAR